MLRGRARELGVLRSALDRREGSVLVVSGPPGAGKTALVEAAVESRPSVYVRLPPLPELQQRTALAAALVRATPARGRGGSAPPSGEPEPWERLLGYGAPPSGAAPAVLVLDDAHRLREARARFLPALRAALAETREAGRALHVVLIGPEPPELDERAEAELGVTRLRLGPLTFRAAAPFLPGSAPADRLRAYALFGGLPANLVRLDSRVSLGTNLRRCVLEPGAPLAEAPVVLLERLAQTPSRYAAILALLAAGEAEWASIHGGVSDLTASGQLAPYLKRLEEMGLIEVRRSLDAGPRSRNRRYRIADAFTAAWFRFVFPHRGAASAPESILETLRDGVEAHLDSILPGVCRQYMRHDVIEQLGSNARECGSLWGPDYAIPVAGVLGSGPAFYGTPVPPGGTGLAELAALDRQIRRTRYGFGRELRLRILFTRGSPSPELAREAARRHDVVAVDDGALLGET